MKKSLIAASLLMAVTGSVFAATGTDGKITFEGEFIDSTCDVTVNESLINNGSTKVSLGKWNAKDYAQVDQHTPLMPVPVKLANCPTAADAVVKVYFRGATLSPTIFKLDADSTATNVGVRLYTSSDVSNVITAMSTALPITLADGKGEGTFYGSYITVNGAAGAGKANSTVELLLGYN